jgi:hypothetical protein
MRLRSDRYPPTDSGRSDTLFTFIAGCHSSLTPYKFSEAPGDCRMIVNRTYDFLFVHVPKTAGIAVSRDLSRFTSTGDIQVCETIETLNRDYVEACRLYQHSTAGEIRFAIGEEEFDRLFKFAFVRDPYSRAYSLLRFLKYNFRRWPNSDIMDTFDTFDQFIASDFFQTPGPDRIFEPQAFWLVDDQGRLMMDRIARMEELETELREIYATIGLPPVEKVKPVNVSGPRGSLSRLAARLPIAAQVQRFLAPPQLERTNLSQIYANDHTQRIVAHRYARDFEMFGYSQEISDTWGRIAPPAAEAATY